MSQSYNLKESLIMKKCLNNFSIDGSSQSCWFFKLNIRKTSLFFMTDETGRSSILHDTWNTSQTLFQAPTLTLRSSLLKEDLGANRYYSTSENEAALLAWVCQSNPATTVNFCLPQQRPKTSSPYSDDVFSTSYHIRKMKIHWVYLSKIQKG